MILIRQIKIDAHLDTPECLVSKIKKKLLKEDDFIDFKIIKKSIDARNKSLVLIVYDIAVSVKNEEKYISSQKYTLFNEPRYVFPVSNIKDDMIYVVGSGPAGLFAAYVLSENGYKVTVLERGKPVEQRKKMVEEFWNTGVLNPNSNVQFGEGGAGTFSDGKLNTGVSDNYFRQDKVLNTFVLNGALENILYDSKPHIGTDILSKVIVNMRNKIISWGGIFRYDSTVTDFVINDDKIGGIVINNSEIIKCSKVILAIGHSARDTFRKLYEKSVVMESKPFAVGVRVQHPQKKIDISQYGDKYVDVLSTASYKLTYKSHSGRGVYSFCMCPGGYVVNSSSNDGKLVINGMSYNARNSGTANSAIIVTVSKDDFGVNPLDGIVYQENLERKCFELCEGKIPTMRLKDFFEGKISSDEINYSGAFKGSYAMCDFSDYFNKDISDSLKEAFRYFGTKIKGFDDDETLISIVESRTSSPVRIVRNEMFESNIKGLYPCGEGAGYAGGITSAAIDGIKVAEKVIIKS